MWAKIDDGLADHPKLLKAGAALGKENGIANALTVFVTSLLWSAKHLTNGALPVSAIRSFRQVKRPLLVARILAKVGLFERNGSGFYIHDFLEFNPSASMVKRKRRADRLRQRRHRRVTAESRATRELRARAIPSRPVPSVRTPIVPLKGDGRKRRRAQVGGTTCHHDPRCRSTTACIALTLQEGRAAKK